MFNDRYGLTEAVLSGRKTKTRRIISQSILDKVNKFQQCYYDATFDALSGSELFTQFFLVEKIGKLPYQIGEIAAIAQSYFSIRTGDMILIAGIDKNGMPINVSEEGIFNKMFVRAELMPHQIRISDVKFEKLQDISDDDCINEGIESWNCHGKRYYGFFDSVKDKFSRHSTPREAFAALIDKVSGKGTWESNPFVFVYDFELVK